MKQFSHAWLAFKAIERLEKANLGSSQQNAMELIRWFWNHRDSVIRGSWYPDYYIKDNATSHIYKYAPAAQGVSTLASLPASCQAAEAGAHSPLFGKPYRPVDPSDDLPERCEALTRAISDDFKMQEIEEKGSCIAPTDNHIATVFFMLSHYIADAHMPLHCDSRQFSSGDDIHAKIEEAWDADVLGAYMVDQINERFFYGPDQYPLRSRANYDNSFLKAVDDGLATRPFSLGYGKGNPDVRSYMQAVTQYSYLLAYAFLPQEYNEKNTPKNAWQKLPGRTIEFQAWSQIIFSDAIDAIARVWLEAWGNYLDWKKASAK